LDHCLPFDSPPHPSGLSTNAWTSNPNRSGNSVTIPRESSLDRTTFEVVLREALTGSVFTAAEAHAERLVAGEVKGRNWTEFDLARDARAATINSKQPAG
jgi:hypothetical protein